MAYNHTYGLPVLITRGCSNYGPYQSPKKFVPQMITKALADETLSLDNGGLNTRNWVHVRDHCRALDLVLHRGNNGEVYNIGGDNEWTDLALAGIILEQLEKPRSLITFNKERLGVRHRRLVSTRKIESELGWQPEIPFEVGIAETARWFQTHRQWW
ncbi:MAG TPA: GDP-mannose 4,6-dehydratase, partial [Bacillota bacterium]|nr:GDP-mannose 4,6-dehydratase [Bacillota bacterium]